jgi:hypothetical protein
VAAAFSCDTCRLVANSDVVAVVAADAAAGGGGGVVGDDAVWFVGVDTLEDVAIVDFVGVGCA